MTRLVLLLQRALLTAALGLCAAPALAQVDLVGDDTDLFTINPNINTQIPNVLIILDNTSNWAAENQKWEDPASIGFYDACRTNINNFGTQQGDAEICAIYKVMTGKVKDSSGNDTATDVIGTNVNLGMMMYEDQQTAGAYVRFPMRNMDATWRSRFLNVIKNISTNNPADKGPSSNSPVNIFNDAFRYFNSFGTYSGVEVGKPGGPPPTLYSSAVSFTLDTITGGAHPAGYTDGMATDTQVSADASGNLLGKLQTFKFPPATGNNSCGDDYIIFIGNGFPSTELLNVTQADITAAAALLNDSTVSVDTTTQQATRVNPDMWSRFLHAYGSKVNKTNGLYRKITTFTINVCNAQCDSDWETVMKSTATPDESNYYLAKNGAAIEAALRDIAAKINAVNTVFAASTLPVSINVRGTNLNQIYIGVFRPDDNLSPRWWGNLKQYRLGFADAAAKAAGNVTLVDSGGVPAVDAASGFVRIDATSYWSSKTTPGFWAFRGNYATDDFAKDQDAPDGQLVEKGGAAQRIRIKYPFPDSVGQERNIYTCTDGSVSGTACKAGDMLSSFPFKASNDDITAQMLGTFASVTVDSLTGSGTTATATINGGHTFSVGDQVVIEGALPEFYNNTFAVTGTNAPTNTTFTFSVTPVPGPTFTPTLGFITFKSLVTGLNLYTSTGTKDRLLVTSSSPSEYDTATAGAVFSAGGNAQQLSYTLASAPAASASAYTVSAVRFVAQANSPSTTSNVVYDTSGKVTVIVPNNNHGYATGDRITLFGAADSAYNVSGAPITFINNNSFSYVPSSAPAATPVVQSATVATDDPSSSPSPTFSWASGQFVAVCKGGFSQSTNATTGAITTSCVTADSFNSATDGSAAVQSPTGTSFTYTTTGNVGGLTPGTGYQAMLINTGSDVNSWTISSGTVTSVTGNKFLNLTLSGNTHTVASQNPHSLAKGDSIAVTGITCAKSNGTQIDCKTGATSGISSSYTVTLTAATSTPVATFAADNNVASMALGATPKVTWTPTTTTPTFSKQVNVQSTTVGIGTVQASSDPAGTGIYVYKTGDLTASVASITTQSLAIGNPTITAANAGSADPAERANLIAWARGVDNKEDENKPPADLTDVRASVHGDVLHSRPAVVNYNRSGDENDVFVFYGANDGMLHAVKGGSASDGGDEQWAFVAPEFFGKLKRLRNQTPIISSTNPRGYFFDGSISVYTLDADNNGKLGDTGDKAYLFVTMRRGGRMLYAIDVSDPVKPVLLWRKGCREATGNGTAVGSGACDAEFGEMGQTWSQPVVGYLRKWPDKPVLIVGAGYDKTVEDFQPCAVTNWTSTQVEAKSGVTLPTVMDTSTCTAAALASGTTVTKPRAQGRALYILDAATGDILWSFANAANLPTLGQAVSGMNYSIAGDVVALRNRTNTAKRANEGSSFESVPTGYFDRIYAPDTGGNVWRIDVANAASPPVFPVTQLASIAVGPVAGTHAALNYRKFTVSPDVVYSSDIGGQYDAVLLGSGDREHVWDRVVQNRFYMFKDRATGTVTVQPSPQTPITESDLFDATNNCIQVAANCTTGTTSADATSALESAKGWKLSLLGRRSTGDYFGEKTVAPATTAAGTVIFNTHEPIEETYSGQCSVLGTARQYGLNYQNATATGIFNALDPKTLGPAGSFATFAGGGFLPQPVPAVVEIEGNKYQTVIAGVQTTNPGGLVLQHRVRTYWYRKTD